MTQQGDKQPDHIEATFVQMANGFSYEQDAMTLRNVGSATLFVCDRPQRVAGYVSTPKFVGE